MTLEAKIIEIKDGIPVVVYGDSDIPASQVAECYGISKYRKLILVNGTKDYHKVLGIGESVILGVREKYPKIIILPTT